MNASAGRLGQAGAVLIGGRLATGAADRSSAAAGSAGGWCAEALDLGSIAISPPR